VEFFGFTAVETLAFSIEELEHRYCLKVLDKDLELLGLKTSHHPLELLESGICWD
jgi:hypothetical protein